MKSNGASFNTIRRMDIAGFFSDGHALAIRCLYPFVTPCAVLLGDLSVLSCGHWRCRDNMLPDWDTSPFPHCCHLRRTQSPGQGASQGWAEQGAVHECASCPGMVATVLPSVIQEIMKDYSVMQDQVLTSVF